MEKGSCRDDSIKSFLFFVKERRGDMNCILCGKELSGRQIKYCSLKCKKLAGERRRSGLPINIKPKRSHLEWTDDDVQNRLNTKNDKIIYIGGYTDSNGTIYLQCKDCGQMFRRGAQVLRKRVPIQCNNCLHILAEYKHREEAQTRKAIIEQERKEKEAERIRARQHYCLRCGKYFEGSPNLKYCSPMCRERQHDSDKAHYRRIRMNNNIHDVISLPMLVKRDKGICWICGGKVDYEDYKVRHDGVFLAGLNYPSIDHVQALANGGSHTWGNTRLAHMRCNSLKGSNKTYEQASGQIKLYL